MRIKKPLTISNCQPADKELKHLTAEAEKLLRATSPTPPETKIKSFAISLAALALYPDMMRGEHCGEIINSFKLCYARRPDATLQILTQLRQQASERQDKEFARQQNEAKTQAGRVREFLANAGYGVKKNGQHIPQEKLTAADFQSDGKTLKSGRKFIPVAELQDGEIAQILKVNKESVKHARQGLAKAKGKKLARKSRNDSL